MLFADAHSLLSYAPMLALLLAVFWIGERRRDARNQERLLAVAAAGLNEPASLHPWIDPGLCHGCGACVAACPEGDVLGLISGRAHLIEPSRCIGHGACKQACPFDAITLVFGTERRGVDIPVLDPNFQTNVPGLYIAGELGGMGLIRNAATQGVQAMEAIHCSLPGSHPHELDVLIVGAGPAGLAASLYALSKGLRFRTVEQYTLGGTVAHFPRGKIVMTSPVRLPLVGKVRFRETSKEALMAFWERIRDDTGLTIHENERVESVRPSGEGFVVRTSAGEYSAARVLLGIGRRGTPRKLGVEGEDLSKVVYRLVDPEQYRRQHVMVVGGGDAALEAAASIAEQDDAGTVTLSYRGDAFARAKPKNRERVEALAAAGRLSIELGTEPVRILSDRIELKRGDTMASVPNDAVIVCAGGILPTGFLREMGINVETHHGRA